MSSFCLKFVSAARARNRGNERVPTGRMTRGFQIREVLQMKMLWLVAALCLAVAGGCASGRVNKLEEDSQTHQKLLRETNSRLNSLESRMSTLDGKVAQLSGATYEVRTKNGKKSGLTVVPVLPQGVKAAVTPPVAAKNFAEPANTATEHAAAIAEKPQGRRIDPVAAPQALPKPAQVVPAAQKSSPAPAPAAQTKATAAPKQAAPAILGLPPESALPNSTPPPVPASNFSATAPPKPAAGGQPNVPVPALPAANLPLPPENPDLGLPPVAAPAAQSTGAQPTAPGQLEQSKAAQAGQSGQPPRAAAPQSGKGEAAAYQAALKPALAGRAAESIPRFQKFLQTYPQGRYAANAEYWIGEGLYSQGKYQEALAQFQKVDATWPRHHKNADALLKAGMTMSRLGDKEGAAQAYKKVLERFPGSEAAGKVRSRGLAH